MIDELHGPHACAKQLRSENLEDHEAYERRIVSQASKAYEDNEANEDNDTSQAREGVDEQTREGDQVKGTAAAVRRQLDLRGEKEEGDPLRLRPRRAR